MTKTALVTGISGQDGSYLSKILLDNNYKVIGLVRDKNTFKESKLKYLSIESDVTIEEVNILDYDSLLSIFEKYRPIKVFNFASQSSVGLSYSIPKETLEFNIQSVVNLLECIRNTDLKTRFFQASSSEIFGNITSLPVNESTPINPNNLYAISKATVHNISNYYKDFYGVFIVSAIFLNHESELRSYDFVIKKIIRDLVKIKHKKLDKLKVGNIDVKRDFGYAPKYMEAVYKIICNDKCNDYVISSGKSLSIRDIIYYVLNELELSKSVIEIDQSFFRVNDIEDIYGDSSKALNELNWIYNIDFFDVLDEMIKIELSGMALGS